MAAFRTRNVHHSALCTFHMFCLELIQLFVYILGKEHIKREKRRRQRLAESVTRRRDFAHRFGGTESDSRGKL